MLSFLVIAPWQSRGIFCDIFRVERKQIAVDNAAITLGRRDREIFRFLSASNRILRRIEVVHHALHFCARTPTGLAKCLAKDILVERQMEAFLQGIYGTASAMWLAARLDAISTAAELYETVVISRPITLPVKALRCPICQRPNRWEWRLDDSITAEVRDVGGDVTPVRIRMSGASIASGDGWNYVLEEGT